jgi:hypothetical protein
MVRVRGWTGAAFLPAVAVAALAGSATAEPKAPSADVSAPRPERPALDQAAPNVVSGVTVTATMSKTAPVVKSTFPASGATVAPGVLVMRVTYDQRMADGGWSYVLSAAGVYPECDKTPRLLDDHKSFALICRTVPKKTYALWFNHGEYDNFINPGRKPAAPYQLTFSTSDADPLFTLEEAMKADPGLPPGSNPAEPVGKRLRDSPSAPDG